MKDLQKEYLNVLNDIGYKRFNRPQLLFQAFTRKSYSQENGGENSETLEFIGDKVIDMIVTKRLSEEFGWFTSKEDGDAFDDEFFVQAGMDEGSFTEIKKHLVSNERFAQMIDELGYVDMLYLGKSDIKNKVWQFTKVKADLLEAIVGAVAIDCRYNFEVLEIVVNNLIRIDTYLDYIKKQQEYARIESDMQHAVNDVKELEDHNLIESVEYEYEDEQVEYKGYMMWVCHCSFITHASNKSFYFSHEISAKGMGTTKKDAKKEAAYYALEEYNKLLNR